MVTEVYQYRCGHVGQTQLWGGNWVSCWANTHELPDHRGLKKRIADIMLGGSTRGLEEMGHKVPLTFSHMVPKKKGMNIVRGDCTECLKSQSLISYIRFWRTLFFCGIWADDDESKLVIKSWLEKCELTTNVCCAFTRGVPEFVRMCTSNKGDKLCTLVLF